MIRVGILTLSDRAAAGLRVDESGPSVASIVEGASFRICRQEVIPDDYSMVVRKLIEFSDDDRLDLIITTGSTGLGPRDIAPEATLAVIERRVPGMAEAMRAASLQKTPHAMISRSEVGVRGRSLIVNLPGSPRAARENLQVLLPALPHAIEKLQGSEEECAQD